MSPRNNALSQGPSEGFHAESTVRMWRRDDSSITVAATNTVSHRQPFDEGSAQPNNSGLQATGWHDSGEQTSLCATCTTAPSPALQIPQGRPVRRAFQSTSIVREEIVVQPPTIFCCIMQVMPSPTTPGCCWTVTLADRQGLTVTVDLTAEELQTYERFQAALLRETGCSFRYLPVEPLASPTQATPTPRPGVVAATRQTFAEDQAHCTLPTARDPLAAALPPDRDTLPLVRP
jgi:hypothetical protein